MSGDVARIVYGFRDLIDCLNTSRSLRSSLLTRAEHCVVKEINIELQRYLGPATSIHVLSEFLDCFDDKNKWMKKLKDEDLSELQAIGNKLMVLQIHRQKN